MRERTLTAVTQEKHLIFFFFFTFSVYSFGFFFFFFPPSIVVDVNIIGTMKSKKAFEFFFSIALFISSVAVTVGFIITINYI